MLVKMKCPLTHKMVSMDIPAMDEFSYRKWLGMKTDKNRPTIQEIFPKLTPDEREYLLTGLLPEVWKANVGCEMRMKKDGTIGR